MWDTDIPFSDRCAARLEGYRRSFCVWTAHARGSVDSPGLALGLVRDRTSYCDGVALKLDNARRDAALEQLWEREMWTDIYRPIWQAVTASEPLPNAIVFEVDKASAQYAGDLSVDEAAHYIAIAHGVFGACRDYLYATIGALRENGSYSGEFDALYNRVESLRTNG